jgi:hypothetical protein
VKCSLLGRQPDASDGHHVQDCDQGIAQAVVRVRMSGRTPHGPVLDLAVYVKFMGAACSGYPQRVRHELNELIQKQIDSIAKEAYGGATDADRWEYNMKSGGSVSMNCIENSSA